MNNLIPVPLKSELKLEVVKTWRDYTLVRPLNRESCNMMGVLMCNCLSGYREALPIYFVMKHEKIICAIELGFRDETLTQIGNVTTSDYKKNLEVPWIEGYSSPVNAVFQIRSFKNNSLAQKHTHGVQSLLSMQYPDITFDINRFTQNGDMERHRQAELDQHQYEERLKRENPFQRYLRKSKSSLSTVSYHLKYIRGLYVRELLCELFPKVFKSPYATLATDLANQRAGRPVPPGN